MTASGHPSSLPPSSVGEFARILSAFDKPNHLAHVGMLPLAQEFWRAYGLDPSQPPETRGLVLCQVISHIIDWHLQPVRIRGQCALCAGLASSVNWQALWIAVDSVPELGLRPRLKDPKADALAAWLNKMHEQGKSPLDSATLAEAPLEVQEILEYNELPDLIANFPRKRAGWKGSPYYRASSLHTLKKKARQALLRHLRACDTVVEDFLHAHHPSLRATQLLLPNAPPEELAAAGGASAPAPPPSIAEAGGDRRPPTPQPARPRPASGSPQRRARARRRAGFPRRRVARAARAVRSQLARRRAGRLMFLLVATICLLVLGAMRSTPPTSASLGTAHVAGFLLAEQWSSRRPDALTVLNLRTGDWRQLWPELEGAQGDDDPGGVGGVATPDADDAVYSPTVFGNPTTPVYAPATGELAFLVQSDGGNEIWEMPLTYGPDGWPVGDVAAAHEIMAPCAGGCGALAWSPSGRWLLFDTPQGLAAVDPRTGATRQVTTAPGDAWPACSPDGRWLAYQRARHLDADIAVVPAVDCLPIATNGRAPRYVEGYRPSWHPVWSRDSGWLAFYSNVSGTGHIYAIALSALTTDGSGQTLTDAQVMAPHGCSDYAWAPSAAGEVLIAACDMPTPDNHHGSLLILAPTGVVPAPPLAVSEGLLVRMSPWWVPGPVLPARKGT